MANSHFTIIQTKPIHHTINQALLKPKFVLSNWTQTNSAPLTLKWTGTLKSSRLQSFRLPRTTQFSKNPSNYIGQKIMNTLPQNIRTWEETDWKNTLETGAWSYLSTQPRNSSTIYKGRRLNKFCKSSNASSLLKWSYSFKKLLPIVWVIRWLTYPSLARYGRWWAWVYWVRQQAHGRCQ